MTNDCDDILRQLRDWQRAGQGTALATVIRTWGSSPRPVGSHLAVESGGGFVGSVSGGCIEGAVIGEARATMADGRTRLLEFGVSDEQAWEVGLACGGRVQVLVQPMSGPLLDGLLAARADNVAVALVTRLDDGRQALLAGGAASGDLALDAAQLAAVGDRLKGEQSGFLAGDENLFVRVYLGAPRLLIVGAVHIAQALAPMARLAGYAVTVIDPRRAFASNERFSDVALSDEWPDEAMERLAPDARTAVVTLTHDPKLDDPALLAALASPAFYIGALGSTRTHAKRLERLREQGAANLERIHGPAGLDLGGRSPAEIAVAVLAQIVHCRYHGAAV
ncbi:XdhC/CoxI family protein [Denitratisoma sp. DHT3]|uniref:XdhC family protein n=1 Tax=Denitratisoma sp. DHT3 TaxID=1981880 RepID=UPI00119874D4|nr:XdhC/CoxI family protein [Denitratisoma sp. DHT3]QDX80111.1 XdhC/CoxI family protein [Denitratisoma sp. DHT3]